MAPIFPSRLRLLSTSFRYVGSRFFLGRADLYFDRVELLGWGRGRTGKRILPLTSLDHIEFKDTDGQRPITVFHLSEGETVEVHLRKPDAWKAQLTSRLDWKSRLERKRNSPDGRQDWTMKDLISYTTSMS